MAEEHRWEVDKSRQVILNAKRIVSEEKSKYKKKMKDAKEQARYPLVRLAEYLFGSAVGERSLAILQSAATWVMKAF